MSLNREKRRFSMPFVCNYLLERPEQPGSAEAPVIIAVHGHAMTPEEMLRLTRPLVGEAPTIAALEGPYQFWWNAEKDDRRVVFHWVTNHEPENSRRLHHYMILAVLRELRVPAARAVLFSYSQSVSLAYRFVCTHPGHVRGAINICGGLPGDWEKGEYTESDAAVLHIATREDHWYPPEVTAKYEERLKKRITDIEFHLLEGGHRIPSAGRPAVQAWLQRISAQPEAQTQGRFL